MKKLLLILSLLIIFNLSLSAQSPGGKELGFGVMLGDPSGLTLKYWQKQDNAFVFDLGTSYFGNPRLNADYLWHFDAFNSNFANLYAGPGVALGFGSSGGFWDKNFRSDKNAALGVRGVFGIDILPRQTPLEVFVELGVLVGLTPDCGSGLDESIGIRFYPENLLM